MIALSDSEPSSPSWSPSATPGCHLAPVRRHWPRSSGRWHRHRCHDTCTHPTPVHSLPSSLSRLRQAEAPSPLSPRASQAPRALASTSRLASERLRVCFELLHLLHPLVGRNLPEVSESLSSGSRPSRPRTPTNLAAAPFMPPFFPLCRIRVCLGLSGGSCHAIPALMPPSCGNTVAAPPCSPPTSTSHVSRFTGAIRARRFYLESSVLSHWCLGRSSRTLYRSEMAGVSRGSSAVPPWPTATPFRRCNLSVTDLHRCGITPGACWCPWIRRISSPSASIRRRRCTLSLGR